MSPKQDDPPTDAQIPFRELADVVHQPVRLAVLTVLNEVERVDFTYVKQLLRVTDGNLGRHLEVLAGAGLIDLQKEFVGRKPRTWLSITKSGRSALALEVEAMRSFVDKFDSTQS